VVELNRAAFTRVAVTAGPAVSGTAQVGSPLTARGGDWTGRRAADRHGVQAGGLPEDLACGP
jgi:hypothetical protein